MRNEGQSVFLTDSVKLEDGRKKNCKSKRECKKERNVERRGENDIKHIVFIKCQ